MWALARFHRASGARVALRANAMVAAIVVFIFGMAPDGLATIRAILLALASTIRPWQDRIAFAGTCVALAATAVPRVMLGAAGWMRSLPASAAMHRRAAAVAIIEAQAFAMLVVVLAATLTATVYHAHVSWAKLAGLALIIVSSSILVLPTKGRFGLLAAATALGAALPGRWITNLLALVALLAADRLAGGLVATQRRRARPEPTLAVPVGSGIPKWIRMSWSSLPIRSMLGGLIVPAIFVAFAYFIVRRNPDLTIETAKRTVRVVGILALAVHIGAMANLLLRSRPVWVWSRSLPWSSTHRVVADAMILGAPLLIVPLALVQLDAVQAMIVASMVPGIAATAAMSLRGGAKRQSGAAGESMTFSVVVGALVAIWPSMWVVAVLLTPLMLLLGARRERRAVAGEWVELQHVAAGDPNWLGAS